MIVIMTAVTLHPHYRADSILRASPRNAASAATNSPSIKRSCNSQPAVTSFTKPVPPTGSRGTTRARIVGTNCPPTMMITNRSGDGRNAHTRGVKVSRGVRTGAIFMVDKIVSSVKSCPLYYSGGDRRLVRSGDYCRANKRIFCNHRFFIYVVVVELEAYGDHVLRNDTSGIPNPIPSD